MKSLPKFLTIAFFALLCFTSCQTEVIEETPINEEELIVAESAMANLLMSTASRDGSVDNILDNANCLAINLPVTVIVNDITITINTLEDLELIEDIFDEFENDDDVLELLFPITIVLNDHTEIVINNQDELDAFVEDCINDDDDDIECIDFQYPISFSIYNTDFQIIDTVVIENDRELHEFIERLENSDSGVILASLNFPVTMVYANGETIEVHNHQELERVLNEARENCDDEEACRKEVVDMYLQECHWEIYRYNGDDHFRNYDIFFNEDGELTIVSENATVAITGRWNTVLTDAGLVLKISELTEFDEDLGGEWLIVECDDDRFELERRENATGTNSTHIVIKKECEDDPACTAQEVRMFLNECHWFAGSNLLDNGTVGKFYFEENGVLVVVSPDWSEEYIGTWVLEVTDYGIVIAIELPEPYQALSRRWKLYECGEHRVKLISEDNYIIFERDCENDNPFDCFEDVTLTECDGETDDDSAIFNLTAAFHDCIVTGTHSVKYFESSADATSVVSQIENPSEYANTTNPQTVYARVELNNGNFEIFVIKLEVEYCDTGCTEEQVDTFLKECIWNVVNYNGSNDFIIYDFDFVAGGDIIITDTNTNDEYSGYWATTQVAEGVKIELANINGPNIQALNDFWIVTDCREDRLVLQNNSEVSVVIEQNCN